ncbi:kinase-like domain-containing protein [Flammula alnicola]|nr:kinase-like domain-containing protein [Flammula alnicola]
MSVSWHQRKTRLASLLKSHGDEDAEGVALDRLMHGQSVIGKTSKTTEIDALRFKDKDLDVVGTLEYGQFGVIDVVTCRLNNCVYVRKSIEKRFALRTRDQCSPQFERDLLLQAFKTDSPWVPHLLCAFQTATHLNLLMDYAEGGTLWDVLESSPHDGRVPEADLRWWAPQIVSAIHWCHSQGFAHRDIKPHNFVLTPDAHILLIDFGSAAPLLPPGTDGSQLIPKRYCLVPCGTCDYISPEILEAHEEALVALEMEDDDGYLGKQLETEGYGVETDWWSLGAMLYEMAYGVAPFFANDIRQTYTRIMNHEKSLRFDQKVPVSHEYQHFLRRLLTHAKQRLGRRNVMEITDHPLFDGVDWTTLSTRSAPPELHLPQFTYSEPKPSSAPVASAGAEEACDESLSRGFAFSAFFQQSSSVSPGHFTLRPSPGSASGSNHLHSSVSASWKENSSSASSFIGFSWGPVEDAFQEAVGTSPGSTGANADLGQESTPRPLIRTPLHAQNETPMPANRSHKTLSVPPTWGRGTGAFSTPRPLPAYSTPMKPYALSPYATLPRTSTVRRTAPRRTVSDREAMKQLVDCVGMSARKKVLESGRKPKILGIFGSKGTNGSGRTRAGSTETNVKSSYGTLRKELRFDRFTTPIPGPDYSAASSSRSRPSANAGNNNSHNLDDASDVYPEDPYKEDPGRYSSSESTDSEGGGPPSPSPSPRPGSAMSMMSRRSGTPTISGYFSSNGTLSGRARSGSGSALTAAPLGDRSATTTTTTSSGLLTIPSAGHLANMEFKIGKPPSAASPVTQDFPVPESAPRPSPHDRPKPPKTFSPPAATPVVVATAAAAPHPLIPDPAPPIKGESKGKAAHVRRKSTSRSGSRLNDALPDQWIRELERRHALIIQDIEDLEDRFAEVTNLVVGR